MHGMRWIDIPKPVASLADPQRNRYCHGNANDRVVPADGNLYALPYQYTIAANA